MQPTALVSNPCPRGCCNYCENTVTLNGSRSVRPLTTLMYKETTSAVELCHDETPHHLRAFVEPILPDRLFAQMSVDTGERAVLACLPRLILVGRPIYGNFHPADRDGDSICFPFCATNSIAPVKSAQSKALITVNVERHGVKSCITVRYNRRRHNLRLKEHLVRTCVQL